STRLTPEKASGTSRPPSERAYTAPRLYDSSARSDSSVAWPRLFASRPPDSCRETTRSCESRRYAAAYEADEVPGGVPAAIRRCRAQAATAPVLNERTSHSATSDAYVRASRPLDAVTSGATVRAIAATPTVVTTSTKPQS